jgi:prepilin-type N-terminal cleavage/methylation domain-containing protein
MFKISNYRGFTLIELMIAVAIIGILSGLVIGIINPSRLQGRARDGNRKEDISVIQGALERYYADNNVYPSSGNMYSALNPSSGIKYLDPVPLDPSSSAQYFYRADGTRQVYCLCAQNLEDITTAASSCTIGANTYTYDHCVKNPF